MIVSTVIISACFLLVAYEIITAFLFMDHCKNVLCVVISSKKVCKREDGFLIREYWNTDVTFDYNNEPRTTTLETSSFCQEGQVLGCYYHPGKNIVFRKRDIRRNLGTRSVTALWVGLVFLFITIGFRITSLGSIIKKNASDAALITLAVAFFIFGAGFLLYSLYAFRHTRKKRVTEVTAVISDVMRKSRQHSETRSYKYYPIYRYKMGGFEHIVQSKAGLSEPPKSGSRIVILVDKKKGGPVEFNDIGQCFVLGLSLLAVMALLIYAVFI